MDLAAVTVVIKSLGLGGAERLLVDGLPYLNRQRFAYSFAYVTPWKHSLAPTISAAGFPIVCLGTRSGRPEDVLSPARYTSAHSARALALIPAAYFHLLRYIRATTCDLLQADLPISGVLARIAGRRLRIPVIYTEHNLQERYHPVTRCLNRVTYRLNDIVFAVSQGVAESIRRNGLLGQGDVDLRTLPNGVPVEAIRAGATGLASLRAELDIAQGRPVVGAVAVFRRQKRLLDWIEVAGRVAQSNPDCLFLLAGDGPEMSAVREKVSALGLADRVRLPGFREDGRRLLALMDIFLMTSLHEGMPIAMLEAMALGIPVVATPVGGIPEVISAGREGLLADTGDIEMLAASVRALLANPSAAASMGDAGYQRVERSFHTRGRVAALESAYDELAHSWR